MRTGGPPKHNRRTPHIVAAFAAIYLIWGSTYLAIKVLVGVLPPLLSAGLRSGSAGMILYAWARARGARGPSPAQWRNGLVAGALMFFLGHGALFWASQRVASGFAALIVATIPLWVASFTLGEGRRATGTTLGGLLLGLVGIAWLHLPTIGSGASPLVSGVLLMGSAAWGAGMIWYRGDRRPASTTLAASLPLLGGGVLLFGASLLLEPPVRDLGAALTPVAIACFAYLVVFGSVVAFSAFAWLLDTVSPTAVASYAFVNPIVALALGWSVGHEPFEPTMVPPTVLVIAAVVLIVRGARAPRPHPPTESPHVCTPWTAS